MQRSKNDLKINIHIINSDIPTNLQNILRAKIDDTVRKLVGIRKEHGIKKNIIYINNRELKPLDLVIRMNPYPEVAFLGWRLPYFAKKNTNVSPALLRSRVLNDPQMIRYKKAFLGQKLRNTLTVLVGNINEIITLATEVGLNPQIYLKKDVTERLERPEDILEKARKTSLIPDDILDQDMIELDSIEEWESFLRNHDISQIDKLKIMNIDFHALIHVEENDNEYVFLDQLFNQAFFKIWNIEQKYLNLNYSNDLQEFSIITDSMPMLVILPRELLRMTINQLTLEGATIVHGYESIDDILANISDLEGVEFAGVMCRENDKTGLKEFECLRKACFFTIDNIVEKDLLDKFRRLEFDITDEREFEILTRNLQSALEDLNFNLDSNLRKYVPSELGSYLKGNFKLICDVIKAIIRSQPINNLHSDITTLYHQEAELRFKFKDRLSKLESAKESDLTPLKPIISEIKNNMIKIKKLKIKSEEIYNAGEKSEMDAQKQVEEIENNKHRLKNIAIKQFSLAEKLGTFLVNDLRKNFQYFKLEKTKNNDTSDLNINTEIQRRVFNFSDNEWASFSNRHIYFITRYKNLVRLLNTLLKAENIPQNHLIKARLPDDSLSSADWVFYDKSCVSEEIAPIATMGRSLFDSQNFNQILTKTEIEKIDLLRRVTKLIEIQQIKAKSLADRDFDIESLNEQHNKLLAKTSKKAQFYGEALQKFRVLNEIFTSFKIFYQEVDLKMLHIHKVMRRLELIGTQENEATDTKAKVQARMAKQIIALTEIVTSFYYSLAFLKFTTRVLQILPKLSQSFRLAIAQNELDNNKLKHRLTKPIQNVMVIGDVSFASDKIIEHLLSMMMLQFRINRDRFRITDSNRYRSYLNRSIDYFSIVLTGDSSELDTLRSIIADIVEVAPNAIIFALCQYPPSLIAELEIMRDTKTIETLSFIRKHAFLSDAIHIKPDNKLHITSLYLYSIS
ncbi:MAG: hypothetical protein JJV97_06445 [SAR324 cluster bacterium]|nr:hypothetical protein [SAR324 cluster bacterium]